MLPRLAAEDSIEHTIVPRLMDRQRPGLIAERRAQVGSLPTTRDMAEAIVRVAADSSLPTGHVVFSSEPQAWLKTVLPFVDAALISRR